MSIESESWDSPHFLENRERIAEFRRAFAMVLQDKATESVDAIFLHALSHGDDDEMFNLAAKLIKEGKAKYIVINGSDGEGLNDSTPGKAWAGKDAYIRRLTELGVDRNKIVLSNPAYHTRQGNDVYLEVAKDHEWKSAITLNQPQQLLRATLGQIQVMKDANYWMRVYATYPEPWKAGKKVHGSQGATQDRRYKLLPGEYDRIETYQKRGDLASFQEFFAYMEKRSDIH